MKSKCPETRYKINPNVTLDRFYQLLNVYFNDMQKAGGYIYQLASLLRLVQKKNRPEKFHLTATNNRIARTVRWSVNNFFTSISPIFRKSCAKERKK